MKVLIIDNFDSFVYNLYQYVGEILDDKSEVIVRRNNIGIKEVKKIEPDRIIISPGPGRPENAGNCIEIIKKFANTKPILGICLGHQAIAYAFGARIVNARRIMHGKTSRITHNNTGIFRDVKNPIIATRYHSLAVERSSLPEKLEIVAFSEEDGEIMGIRHNKLAVFGLQFHPESILTQEGKKIIKNFLNL